MGVEYDERDAVDSMRPMTTRNVLWIALGDAWRLAPRALVGAALGYLLQSGMPAAQVLVIAWLTHALSQGERPMAFLAPTVLATTLLIAFTGALTRIAARLGEHMQNTMRCGYRSQLARTIASLPPTCLVDPTILRQIRASQRAIYQLGYLPEHILAVVTALFGALTLSLVIWQINALAGTLVLLTLLPTVLSYRAIASVSSTIWPTVAEYERRGHYALQQLTDPRPATELAALGTGQRMAVAVARWEQAQVTALRHLISAAVRAELLAGLATSVLLGGALTALVIGHRHPGDIAAVVIGILSALSAVRGLGAAIGQLMVDTPRLAELHAILREGRHSAAQSITTHAARIEARNLTVVYPGCTAPAIRAVSLEAKPGEMVALVGVNGAGKTTCISALLGLLAPQQGMVLIDGQDARLLTDTQRLGHFGLLTQEFGRYELTIRESLLLASPQCSASDVELWAALRAARAEDMVRMLPDGLDTQYTGLADRSCTPAPCRCARGAAHRPAESQAGSARRVGHRRTRAGPASAHPPHLL